MHKQTVMQRPVMDPTFLNEREAPPPKQWRWVVSLARMLRWIGRKLLSRPFRIRRRQVADFQESWSARLVRGFACRLLFAPILIAIVACAFVFIGTHPRSAVADRTPGAFDLYYEQVSFSGEDGVTIGGWLVPVVDARRVMLHRDRLLHQTYPAVVLVHDHGQSPQQMLPLVAPLHEESMVVLAIGVRGTGLSGSAAQTFGLNEAGDVVAAVNLLRQHPFVDGKRIVVVGLGTGANAAVLAAERDAEIRALVLLDPIVDARDVINSRLGPDNSMLQWMQPARKWAFEIAYRHDIEEISLARHQQLLASRSHLRLDQATQEARLTAKATEAVRIFCRQAMR